MNLPEIAEWRCKGGGKIFFFFSFFFSFCLALGRWLAKDLHSFSWFWFLLQHPNTHNTQSTWPLQSDLSCRRLEYFPLSRETSAVPWEIGYQDPREDKGNLEIRPATALHTGLRAARVVLGRETKEEDRREGGKRRRGKPIWEEKGKEPREEWNGRDKEEYKAEEKEEMNSRRGGEEEEKEVRKNRRRRKVAGTAVGRLPGVSISIIKWDLQKLYYRCHWH